MLETLRLYDEFAGKAISGLCVNRQVLTESDCDEIAQTADRIAHALVVRRYKRIGGGEQNGVSYL